MTVDLRIAGVAGDTIGLGDPARWHHDMRRRRNATHWIVDADRAVVAMILDALTAYVAGSKQPQQARQSCRLAIGECRSALAHLARARAGLPPLERVYSPSIIERTA
jgi:hypothetical protein